MTLRCRKCASLNADDMSVCGSCGSPLADADHFEFKPPEPREYSGENVGVKCPYCGWPMEEGVLELPSHHSYRPQWVGHSGSEPIGGFDVVSYEFEGYRCTKCSCMLVSY